MFWADLEFVISFRGRHASPVHLNYTLFNVIHNTPSTDFLAGGGKMKVLIKGHDLDEPHVHSCKSNKILDRKPLARCQGSSRSQSNLRYQTELVG